MCLRVRLGCTFCCYWEQLCWTSAAYHVGEGTTNKLISERWYATQTDSLDHRAVEDLNLSELTPVSGSRRAGRE